jgi:hypothetical protein
MKTTTTTTTVIESEVEILDVGAGDIETEWNGLTGEESLIDITLFDPAVVFPHVSNIAARITLTPVQAIEFALLMIRQANRATEATVTAGERPGSHIVRNTIE